MTRRSTEASLALLILLAASCSPSGGAPAATSDRQVFQGPLPEMAGDRLRSLLVEVTYAPGDSSTPHRHPCPVIGYVIQGALRIQVEGSAERVVHVGESFYEAPMREHHVSANASRSSPARFLAVLTCDRDGPVSIREKLTPDRGNLP